MHSAMKELAFYFEKKVLYQHMRPSHSERVYALHNSTSLCDIAEKQLCGEQGTGSRVKCTVQHGALFWLPFQNFHLT